LTFADMYFVITLARMRPAAKVETHMHTNVPMHARTHSGTCEHTESYTHELALAGVHARKSACTPTHMHESASEDTHT
jgi:hypothetical protein